MIQLRYPNITGKTPEERQNQMERYVRSLVDQLNMQKTKQEPAQKQETVPNTLQTKTDWKSIYPVGAIFLSVSAMSPEKLFGGKWEQITDRFLLAAGGSYPAGDIGGEATHKLTTNEMPSHYHQENFPFDGASVRPVGSTENEGMGYTDTSKETSGNYKYLTGSIAFSTASASKPLYPVITNSAGSGTAHNNMPPYLAVYVWKRIA